MLKIIIVLISFITVSNIQAQHIITGWTAGLNISSPIIEIDSKSPVDLSTQWETARLGLNFGVFNDFLISDKLNIRTHLAYEMRRYNYRYHDGFGYLFSSLNTQLDLQLELTKGIDLYTGINIGYLFNVLQNSRSTIFSDEFTLGGPPNSFEPIDIKTINVTKHFTTIDYQWMLGCIIKLNTNWGLNLEHGLSLRNIEKETNDGYSIRLQTITVGIVKKIK